MDAQIKSRVFFHAERFPYPKEVAYRLGHELSHGLMYLTQHDEPMQHLRRLALAIRQTTGSQHGLTALGSLSYYEGDQKKADEDATELLAMYAWSPENLEEYLKFLSTEEHADIKARVGIERVADTQLIYEQVEAVFHDQLDK